MILIDTHCHIHDTEFYPDSREAVYKESRDTGVDMLCVGTSERSSMEAVAFAQAHPGTHAIVGVHPHDTKEGWGKIRNILDSHLQDIVGIGEIGLDYFYTHSPRETQLQALREQLALAVEYDLPVSFHVREAFDDFWPIFDNFHGVRGVMHSFTDTEENAEKGFARGLFVGLNGISTFTKNPDQVKFFTSVPLRHILLETDAPYLTPKPFRGKMNLSAYVGSIAEFHARARNVPLELVCNTTTANAEELFGVKFSEYQSTNDPRNLPKLQRR